ncbi:MULTISPECIES: DciA family protein [Actinoalloteichus]
MDNSVTPGVGPVTGRAAAPDGASGDSAALSGPDLARAALEAARAQVRAGGGRPGAGRSSSGRPGRRRARRRGWSGARPDERDPQPLGRLAVRMVAERGWGDQLAGGALFGRWDRLVGPDIAEHVRPVTLRDGELTVLADSTAWATQLRLLQRQLLERIAGAVGQNLVRRLRIQGPSAPSWRYGPKHVPGRGPRDTYG